MFEESRALFDEVKRLSADQRGPFVTWLVISLIRDVAYYVAAALVALVLGRRLIQAMLAAYRESKRERA